MKLKRIKNKIVSAQGTKKIQNKKKNHFIVIRTDNENRFSLFFDSAIRTALTNSVKNTVNCFLYNLTHYWYIHIYF